MFLLLAHFPPHVAIRDHPCCGLHLNPLPKAGDRHTADYVSISHFACLLIHTWLLGVHILAIVNKAVVNLCPSKPLSSMPGYICLGVEVVRSVGNF